MYKLIVTEITTENRIQLKVIKSFILRDLNGISC